MIAPPLLVSFTELNGYLSALSDESRERYQEKISTLFDAGLPPLVSISCLATLFGFSSFFVQAMVKNNNKQYRSFIIKQGKKKRKIDAPKVGIKVIQKWFGFHLSKCIEVKDCVYGFIPNRSAVDAAARHCNALWVYSVDIKDFFPNTNETTVNNALVNLGYSDKASDLLVSICCYQGSLPQGAPSSPVLSNLVMSDVDSKLVQIAIDNNLTYTRYADDIVFSGTNGFPPDLKLNISNVFDLTCWDLNSDKEYFSDATKGQRLKVHGLLVMKDKPILTKGYRNKIRAYKHMIKNEKVDEADVPRIRGHINYSDSVDKWISKE